MNDAPNRIRELRNAAKPKLSQQALGDRIGVSKMTISDLERGEMELTVNYMRRIAKVLNVSAADLLARDDNPIALDPAELALIERLREASPDARATFDRVTDAVLPFRHRDAA